MSTAPNTTIDPALAKVAEANAAHLVTAEPANHAGIAAVSVGSAALTPGDGAGDWTIADAGGPWASDSGVTVGAASAGANSITLSGLTVSQTDHILAGAVLLIAGDPQPYTVQADADSDGAGDATVTIEPELQVATSGGEAVTDASGRKVSCAEQTGITIDNGDTGNSTVVGVAYTDGTTLKLYKALSESKVYSHGDTASIPQADLWQIGDPVDR